MLLRHRSGLTAHLAPRSYAVVLLVLALAAVGCSSEGLRQGDAATVTDGSSAQVAVGDDEWEDFEAGSRVPDGASVRAGDSETGLTFRDGAVRLAPGSAAVVHGDRIELTAGEALVDGSGSLDAVVGDTTVSGDGLFRISSGLSSRVAVYSGTASVSRPAQQRTVPALRQLDLSAFRLAAVGKPLHYVDRDAWDQEFLGDAIAFDGEAARLAGGIDVEVGRAPLRPRFYATFAGRQVVRFLDAAATVQRRGGYGPASDVLLTVFVSRAASGPLGPAVNRVTALRDAGARWGLVALELDVAADRVVAAIDALGDRRLGSAAEEAAIARDTRRRSDRTDGGGTAGATGTDVAGGATAPTTSTSTTTTTTSTGGGGVSTPPPGGSGGDGGDDPGDGDSSGGTVENVVSEVVKRVENPTGGGEDGKSPVGGALPELP